MFLVVFGVAALGTLVASAFMVWVDERTERRFRFENDPRFLARIEKARASVRAGRAVPLEEV